MSDERAIEFVAGIADQFREHALALLGEHEPLVIRGAAWTEDGVVLDYIVEPGGMLPNRVSRDAVLELLARTYRARSGRAVDWQVPLPPSDYQDLLEARFPVYVGSGLEVGPGWFDLLWAAGEWLEDVDPERDSFLQVKEKFGSARLHGPVTNAGEPIIEAAEFLSRYICDVCGKPGSNREVRGWMATRCDEHRHA